MLYILYKTTNKVNGKYYIGIHRTDNIDDGYMGSGKLLRAAIKKYGIENFEREIIKYCNSLEELVDEERSIVNEQFVLDKSTYNMELGGAGGKIWNQEMRSRMSDSKKGSTPWNKGKKTNQQPSDEGRERLRSSMLGSNNHMFGIDVATKMTPEANAERLRKISIANSKPKSKKEKYKEYSSKRFWIVDRENRLYHCIDDNDPRLIDGSHKRGRKWKEQ